MRLWALKVLLIFSLLMVPSSNSICPRECRCSILEGHMSILCIKGDMMYLPMDMFDRRAHYIFISPPPDKPNYLTLGPIFIQPMPFLNLIELHMINSNIPLIGQYSFWGLQNLQVINLAHNAITEIETDNFRGLISLVELYLDFNAISVMPSETFRHLTSLTTLNLSHNNISYLSPRQFRMLANLLYLDLSYNPLGDINPEVFKDVPNLWNFICRHCMLKRINVPLFYFISQLEYLDLGENEFKYLNADEFVSLRRLIQLKLDGNQLPVIIDNLFSKQKNLQSLSLQQNRLALLAPAAFTNLTSLVHLDISNNKLDRFHLQTFAPIVESVRTINFSSNNLPLNEIAIVLQILPELQGVGLAYLSIEEIPVNYFAFNRNLVAIDISGNKISKFPTKALSKVRFLQRLNMSYNRLQALDESSLERLEAVAQIDIGQNPWRCDSCSIGAAMHYMERTVLNATLRQLSCNSPARLRNKLFAELTQATLERCTSAHEAQVSVIAGLVLVCIAILAVIATVLCCKRRRAAHYYTNEEKRRSRAADERNTEAPGELLPCSDLGSVATIHAPYHLAPKSS